MLVNCSNVFLLLVLNEQNGVLSTAGDLEDLLSLELLPTAGDRFPLVVLLSRRQLQVAAHAPRLHRAVLHNGIGGT